MGLGWGGALPVDTHVWQIAQRDYKFGKTKTKTFNKVMYEAVGDHFRELFGDYAGWAHSVLFTADLRTFADQAIVKKENKEVKQEEDLADGVKLVTKKRKQVVKFEVKTEDEVGTMADIADATNGDGNKRRRTRSGSEYGY